MTDELIEALAAYAHDAWSGWMVYLFSKLEVNSSSQLVLPREWYDRWHRQTVTEYAGLSEAEQESDRKEARRMIAIVEALSIPAKSLEEQALWYARLADDRNRRLRELEAEKVRRELSCESSSSSSSR